MSNNSNISNFEISTRQLCLLLAIFLPVSKLNLLPALLSGTAGNDLLLSALGVFLLEGLAVFAVLWLMTKQRATMSEIITQKFGKVTAKIYLFILAIYLLFSCLYPLLEHRSYVLNTMYDTRPSLFVFLPFFLFSTYAAAKGLQCIGRSADIALFFFAPAFLGLIFMAVASADFTTLLPIGRAPISAILQGGTVALASCTEAAYLIVLQGHVRVERHFLRKTMSAYAVGALCVLIFLAVFYGIFSTVGVRELYALTKIARYYNALKTIGRVDQLFIYAITIVQLFALVAPVQLCVHTFCECFGTKKRPLLALIVNAVLLGFIIYSADRFMTTLQFVIQYGVYPILVFSYLIPIFSPLFAIKKKGGGTHARV